MTTETATTNADNGNVTFDYIDQTQVEISRYEAIIKDKQLQVQMINQDIKSHKAKVKILKEFLNEKE